MASRWHWTEGTGIGQSPRAEKAAQPEWMRGAGRAPVTGVCRGPSGPGPARQPQEDVTALAQASRSRVGGEGGRGPCRLPPA